MIYIISEKKDLVTDLVIEWITTKRKQFKRFNDDEFVKDHSLLKSNVSKLWLRRGTFNVIPNKVFSDFFNRIHILNYLNSEVREYSIYLEYALKKQLEDRCHGSR